MAHLPPARWQRYRLLEGNTGPLVIEVVALRVVTAREGLPAADGWLLVRRPAAERDEPDPAAYKYYLSNAPAETPLPELVRVLGMRWLIECCFEEGKGELGLDQYEVRSWCGWHHHMTLVLLAHHFLVRVQQRLNQREGGQRSARSAAASSPRA
jgi:SRSO17 transposase